MNARYGWQEFVNPFTTYERQALVEADLGMKPPRPGAQQWQVRELMETTTDAFCTLDREWRCLYLNDQFECY